MLLTNLAQHQGMMNLLMAMILVIYVTFCKTMLTLVVTDAKKFEGMGLVEK